MPLVVGDDGAARRTDDLLTATIAAGLIGMVAAALFYAPAVFMACRGATTAKHRDIS